MRNNRAFPKLASVLVVTAVIYTGLAYCLLGQSVGFSMFGQSAAFARSRYNSPNPNDREQMKIIRAAGLRGDQSQIPSMRAALKNLPPFYSLEAIRGLARLGAIVALPDLDAVIRSNEDQNVTNFATVARARLVAEDRAKSVPGTAVQAAARVNRFYTELGLSPDSLNAVAAIYQGVRERTYGPKQPTPVEVAAIQELADMVYHGSYKDYAGIPGVARVNFVTDYGAALKMRLAPLTREQRIVTMVQELASRRKWSLYDNLEAQLLVDEGAAASRAVAAQLAFMETHHAAYPAAGFGAMFGVLYDIGDSKQAPLVERFKTDSDPEVANYARSTYPGIVRGIGSQVAVGY